MEDENSKDQNTLSQLFDSGLRIQGELEDSKEDTSSSEVQDKVRKGILMLEDATRLVSVLDLFSRNENFQEIPTEHLKYFLLPVLLGDLTNRLTELAREKVVETVQVYYVDFLSRCRDYGVGTVENVPSVLSVNTEPPGEEDKQVNTRPDLAKMNSERSSKMERYRQTKQLETDIKEMRMLLAQPDHRDEELVRKYHIKLILRFINTAMDEMSSLHMEVGVLEHMAKLKAGHQPPPTKQSRKLEPIIITRDAIQKEVYGLGYPSLPVLSVDEFYEKRVAEGWWKPPSSGGALQDRAANPELEARMKEEEEREKDDKEDRDDEEQLAKSRAWSDWKDDHRRGEGNRHNMG